MQSLAKQPLNGAGLISALVLLVLISYITYSSNLQFSASSRWVGHTYNVINQLNTVLSELKDAETAQRGYLLTGDASHLELYQQARQQLPQQILTLKSLTQDNPTQFQEMASLEKTTAERLRILQQGIDKANESQLFGPQEVHGLIAQGRQSMQQVRQQIQRMTQLEDTLLKSRAEQESRSSQRTRLWIILGNFVAISILLFTFWRVSREVALRKQAQAQAEKHALEIEDLYNNAPCAYHSVDQSGVIVRMNSTALEWLGYTRDEVEGKKRHPELMTAESAQYFYSTAFPLFKKQGWLQDIEFDYQRKDGSVFSASLNATTVYDEQGQYLFSRTSFYDITERKQNERKISNLNQQLAQKAAELETTNKELESFSYSVSHDLRSPLRAIDGYAHMFEEDYAATLDAEGMRLLGVIRSNSKKMGRLIDDLLAFSRLGRKPVDATAVDMDGLVNAVWAELLANMENVRADFIKPQLPPAWGDSVLLRQVLQNLLSNAAKYSSKCEQPRIEMTAQVYDNEVIYSIRDNGVGFDMQYYNKLFGVFQRLHRDDEFPGTGVGLAIVERVIGRHGGRVWAESEIGVGSTFNFSLPRGNAV